jgi:hypothetical protein
LCHCTHRFIDKIKYNKTILPKIQNDKNVTQCSLPVIIKNSYLIMYTYDIVHVIHPYNNFEIDNIFNMQTNKIWVRVCVHIL